MTTALPSSIGALRHRAEIHYPESDGKPMAETDTHRREMVNAIATLQAYYEKQKEIYISGNMLLYYQEGIPSSCVAPDVFLVKGVPKHERRVYKLWAEGKAPDIVIEFSSRSTRLEDKYTKRALYYELGVKEYYLVDPLREYLKPPFQGFHREEGDFVPMARDQEGAILSHALGLLLRLDGDRLRFVETETGKLILTPQERARKEAARADQLEIRAEREAARAEREAARAEQEAARAAQETAARQATEAELSRLKVLLAKAGIEDASLQQLSSTGTR